MLSNKQKKKQMNDDALRFPIGKFTPQDSYSQQEIALHISRIESLPKKIETVLTSFTEKHFNATYRDGGWTSKQVVHHVADSHMNAFIRFKLGLTEDNPTIKPYDEAAWAALNDTQNLPVNISLTLLHALHKRWHELLINITQNEWSRTVFHPGYDRTMSLWQLLAMYAWHGKHHTAHITALRERKGW